MRKSKEYRFIKPEPYRLGTVFPVKVTSTNNDGTFNGTFDFDRMNADQQQPSLQNIFDTLY